MTNMLEDIEKDKFPLSFTTAINHIRGSSVYNPDLASTEQLLHLSYRQASRFYHGLEHIYEMLLDLKKYNKQFRKLDHLSLSKMVTSIWFHDLVLLPFQPDRFSVQASDFAACAFLRKIGALHKIQEEVHQQIRATSTEMFYQEINWNEDAYLIHDLDYLRLAYPYEQFKAHRRQVEDEYCLVVPRHTLTPNIGSFLRFLLKKPALFYTEYYHDTCEKQARLNIRQYLKEIDEEEDRGAFN